MGAFGVQSPAPDLEVLYPWRSGPAFCRRGDQTPDKSRCEGLIPCQTLACAGVVCLSPLRHHYLALIDSGR